MTGLSPIRTWTALGTVYVVWGSTYLATAILAETIPPLIGVGARYLLAAAILAAFLLLRNPGALRITAVELRTCAFVGVTMMGLCLGYLALALYYVPTGEAALLVCVMPIWVVLIRRITGDRPGWRTIVGVAVGFIGVVVMLLPGGGAAVNGSDGDLMWWSLGIILSSGVWAWVSWLTPRLPAPVSSSAAMTYQMLCGGGALVLVGALAGERVDAAAVTSNSLWALAYLVVAGSLIAWTAFMWVLRNVPVSLGSTYAYVNPVVAVLLGVAFYGELVTADIVIGCTVVLGGVALVVSGESRGRPLRPPVEHNAHAGRQE